ncbi:MAG: hypothetical protein VW667_04550 [Candidatus Neomarinimicrobiota bacterium]
MNTGTAHGIKADIKNQAPKIVPVKRFTTLYLYVINIAGSIYIAANICHLNPSVKYCTIAEIAARKRRYKKGLFFLKEKRLSRDPAVRNMVIISKGFMANW